MRFIYLNMGFILLRLFHYFNVGFKCGLYLPESFQTSPGLGRMTAYRHPAPHSQIVYSLSLWTGEALGKQDPNAPFFLRGRGEREGDRMRMGEGRDATNWDEQGYRSSILQERETQSRTVFRTVFAPSPNPNPDVLVVASSDGSLAPYSISSCISSSQVSLLLPFLLNPDPPICRPRPPHSLALDSGQRNWNLGGAHRQWVLQTHGLCATCST